jgi:hypothetical protein
LSERKFTLWCVEVYLWHDQNLHFSKFTLTKLDFFLSILPLNAEEVPILFLLILTFNTGEVHHAHTGNFLLSNFPLYRHESSLWTCRKYILSMPETLYRDRKFTNSSREVHFHIRATHVLYFSGRKSYA